MLLSVSIVACKQALLASEVSLARTRERGALPLARAFSQNLFHSPKQESLLAGYEYRGDFPKLCDFAVFQ